MKKVFTVFLIFLLASCFSSRKISKKRMIGVYVWSDYDLSQELTLRADNSYELFFDEGLEFRKLNGEWKTRLDTLILNDSKNLDVRKYVIKRRRLYDLSIPKESVFKKYLKKE